jgi:ADP-ribose pyrophosphatase YjhB (NUDIX family)
MGETKGFKVRVGVVLVSHGKLLLVRQNDRPFWVFPGGTLEQEEGLETCAIREIQEELGLTIRVVKLLYVADFMHPKRHAIDVFFLGEIVSGQMTLATDENLNEAGYFTLEQLKRLDIQPAVVAQRVLAAMEAGFDSESGGYVGEYAPNA